MCKSQQNEQREGRDSEQPYLYIDIEKNFNFIGEEEKLLRKHCTQSQQFCKIWNNFRL